MLKATNTTSTTVSANGVVPITLKKNTFSYVSLTNNAITIRKAGNYKINAVLNITATGTTANIGLYNNGVLIPETNATITTTSGDEYQLVINDLETIIYSLPTTTSVVLTLQSTTGFTTDIVNLDVIELAR